MTRRQWTPEEKLQKDFFYIESFIYDLRRFSVRRSQKIKKLLLEKSIAYNFERMVKVAMRSKKKKTA